MTPHAIYHLDLRNRIRAAEPMSMVDVGCGKGTLLRELSGIPRRLGLEVDEAQVAAGRAAGLDVQPGRAESLPFGDRSVDVVVLEYVAHHVAHLERALLEAARVAARAVFILDPWYDAGFASQGVARDFDLWLKTIDRRRGMVHNPCASADQLARPFLTLGGFDVDCTHRLVLQDLPMEQIEAAGRRQLEGIAAAPELERALSDLLDRARLAGITQDGAILLSAVRNRP